MSAKCFLESGSHHGAARRSEDTRHSLAAPWARQSRVLRRAKQQSSQLIFAPSTHGLSLGSSRRRSQEVCCYAGAEQLDSLRSHGSSSLAERIFEENYRVGELLGVGSFGKVYRATHRSETAPDYAVKIVSKHREGFLDERVARRIHEEVRKLYLPTCYFTKGVMQEAHRCYCFSLNKADSWAWMPAD